jgi:hypothetical protein
MGPSYNTLEQYLVSPLVYYYHHNHVVDISVIPLPIGTH